MPANRPCLFYATSLTFPSDLANRRQVVHQAKAFAKTGRARVVLSLALGDPLLTGSGVEVVRAHTRSLPRIAWHTRKLLREYGATHLFCREIRLYALLMLFRAVGLLPRVAFIFEAHRLSQPELLDSLLLRTCLPSSDYVVTVNGWMQHELERWSKKVCVLTAHDAADPAVFRELPNRDEARASLGVKLDAFVAVYTGRFRTMGMDKGIENVLQSLSRVSDAGVPIQFYAIGASGEELADYSARVRELNLEGFVTLVTYRTQQEVALYHAAADVLLMPFPRTKHFTYYMSPMKLFEYLMAGRPIIATRLPSITDVVNERNAVLIEPGDIQALSSALVELARNPDKAASLSSQALADSERYTWDKRASAILDFIRL